MQNKILKKALKIVIIVLLAVIACAVVLECFYLGRYLFVKKYDATTDNLDTSEIRVMSCNLRCWSPTDLFKKSWFYRAGLIVDTIKSNQPDIIGFQEASGMHYAFLQQKLVGYASVIQYRDNSLLSEGCPVFYRTDKFDLIDQGSFWLSNTPDVMSKDWGAAHYRVANYVILQEKDSGREFVVFNTHLDHVSDEARINGIQVVLDKIEQFGGQPAILMGDLNAEEDSPTYSKASSNFDDVQVIASNTMDSCTYQNWGNALDRPRIDYIFVSKSGFTALKYQVITTTYDGVYASDHFPLLAVLKLD